MFVKKENKDECKRLLDKVVSNGIDFKVNQKFLKKYTIKIKKTNC